MNAESMDWDNQRVFLAILREGSLSAAARALGIAQPTVRRRLEALEAGVGFALFTRSPAGLMPTEAAWRLGAHAEAMAAAAAAFERASSGDLDAVAGTVRITTSDVVGTEVLPAMLTELREHHPALVVEVHLSNRNEDLLRQDADLAVRMVRPAQVALVTRRAGAIPLGFFAAPSYVQRHGVPRAAAELRQFALIGPDRDTRDLEGLRPFGLDVGPKEFAVRMDNQVAQLAAIRAGLGIGMCQTPLARRAPALVPVLPELRLPALEAWIVMHEDLRRVHRVRATFDHLAAAFARYTKG